MPGSDGSFVKYFHSALLPEERLPVFLLLPTLLLRVVVQHVANPLGLRSGLFSPRSVLGVSADRGCCFWQQNQLQASELQPGSHSPKDLDEGEVYDPPHGDY